MNVFRQSGGFLSNVPPVVKNLLAINVLVFVGMLIDENYMIEHFALYFPGTRPFEFWQLITHMFLHDGWLHIFFNMYTLLIFGSVLENYIGSKKFLLLYFLSAFGAVALHFFSQYMSLLFSSQMTYLAPTVGASGAIFGVVIGYVMIFPNSILMLIFPPIPMKAKWLAIIFVVIELVLGIIGYMDGVAHFAHLGGIFTGFLLMYIWKKTNRLYNRDKWF